MMKYTKGSRILIVSAGVVLIWSFTSIVASFHAIHYDLAVVAVLAADSSNAHHDSRQVMEKSSVEANSLHNTARRKKLKEVLDGDYDTASLLRVNVDRYEHMGKLDAPSSTMKGGVTPLLHVPPHIGGARNALIEQRKARMKEANVTPVSQLKHAPSFRAQQPSTPGQDQQAPRNHAFAKRMRFQRPQHPLTPVIHHNPREFIMEARAKSARGVEMQPKSYDAALLQSRPTICAERNVTSSLCNLRPCHDGENGHNDNNNGYGFVLHQYNTRGAVMLTAGAAKSGSGCAISHKYKFVFIHVLKSGGTTMKGFLKRGLCGGDDGPPKTCPGVLEIVDCHRAVLSYPHYFVFSFIRNPFDRTYSAYSMAESMRGKHQKEKQASFEDFVFMDRAERKRFSLTSPSHYLPQANFIFDAAHCPVVDFIGRLERFGTDLQVILNYIQSPELQAYFDKQQKAQQGNQSSLIVRENCTSFGERKKNKELDGKLSNAYRSEDMIKAVAHEFAIDFRLLRYDDTKIQ